MYKATKLDLSMVLILSCERTDFHIRDLLSLRRIGRTADHRLRTKHMSFRSGREFLQDRAKIERSSEKDSFTSTASP